MIGIEDARHFLEMDASNWTIIRVEHQLQPGPAYGDPTGQGYEVTLTDEYLATTLTGQGVSIMAAVKAALDFLP